MPPVADPTDPAPSDRLRLTVLIDRDHTPIRGLLIGPDSQPGEPFEGWMELTGLIESARMHDTDGTSAGPDG